MSETGKKVVKAIVILVVFIICMVLVITGQRHVGPGGLITMLVGLGGLVVLLWLYNRQYK